ncbi:MAG: hypothetical protein JEZ00_07300 [Anaerolineaceae bacterium]|nr:hypothetical protein [Anaerolineaceae bacterium]
MAINYSSIYLELKKWVITFSIIIFLYFCYRTFRGLQRFNNYPSLYPDFEYRLFFVAIPLAYYFLFLLFIILWQFTAKEFLLLTPDAIIYQYTIFGIGIKKIYIATKITDLKINEKKFRKYDGRWNPLKRLDYSCDTIGGAIGITYENRFVHLCIYLNQNEARKIIVEIIDWYGTTKIIEKHLLTSPTPPPD